MTDVDMTEESLPSSGASFLMSDVGCTQNFGQFSTFSLEEKEAESEHSSCHSISSLLDMSPSISTSTLSTTSSISSALSSACETTNVRARVLPLSSQERKAHYEWLDGIIGPASGIQESVGTYKAFMERQREVYYNRLLIAEQPTKVAIPRRATSEFASWVGSTLASEIPVHEAPQPVAPQVELRFTEPAITRSASSCCSSPGPRGTGTDTGQHSRTRGITAVPQSNSRPPCSILGLGTTFPATNLLRYRRHMTCSFKYLNTGW
ncbi:hypothetical protein F5148DRAFT_227293 [Russula earlei]|uniref:Uncharacterized protein n=1 Tax=Russula earlei TaxID=71964 RepID=A0ACC0UJC4_9AGAM|nr:hypothetical protein F5148DRAFT_227293 [Russula earlei]